MMIHNLHKQLPGIGEKIPRQAQKQVIFSLPWQGHEMWLLRAEIE